MKKTYSAIYIIIFLSGALLGYRPGASLGIAIPNTLFREQHRHQVTFATLPNGQRSVLFVAVDKLKTSRPALKGVWLILYLPDDPRITLLPIYPTLQKNGQWKDSDFENAFQIHTNQGKPYLSSAFLQVLKDKGLWWSGYLLIDEHALGKIASYVDETQAHNQRFSPIPNNRQPGFITSRGNVNDPIVEQAILYQTICGNASQANLGKSKPAVLDIFQLKPDHWNINFGDDQMKAELQLLQSYGSQLFCDFPLIFGAPLANQ
jgi:hypothetical protein